MRETRDNQGAAPDGRHIDAMPSREALEAMLQNQLAAVRAVGSAIPGIDAAAHAMAEAVGAGARIAYAAAGSSGLMSLADACELSGTFGLPQEQIMLAMAGGVPHDGHMPGDTEDDTGQATRAAAALSQGDLAIVVSASGTTPFALAFAQAARAASVRVVGIANVPGSTLLQLSDIAIALPTPPEVVSGSTRLGAGTSQKIALNMISTQAGVLLGHVYDGLMVNLRPDNIKLRERAVQIVMRIAGAARPDAEAALGATDFDTKRAVLIAAGASAAYARDLLRAHHGHLGPGLQALRDEPRT